MADTGIRLKKQKLNRITALEDTFEGKRISVQLKSENGSEISQIFDVPANISVKQLQSLLDTVLKTEDRRTYSFFVDDVEITESLEKTASREVIRSNESVLDIVYQPQAVFRVHAVTRCTSTLSAHSAEIMTLAFSPDGRHLATGSGDTTVRFWDLCTETAQHTCKGHKNYILCVSWSPDGRKLASGSFTKKDNGQVIIWDPMTGQQIGQSMTGHKTWVTCLSWRPLHLDPECRYLVSASKDTTARVWDVFHGSFTVILTAHSECVQCVKWGGTDLIYTASSDRTIKVWRFPDGVLCRTLIGHSHRINALSLNTEYVMRTAAFDPADAKLVKPDITLSVQELSTLAEERYKAIRKDLSDKELLVSGSDDAKIYLWQPESSSKPLKRMDGHMQGGVVIDVKFSPDGRIIASASFDHSIRLWHGQTGVFISTLRGHVQRVFRVAWSADSRLLVSAGEDSTVKVWDIGSRKLAFDLPGHADQSVSVMQLSSTDSSG